MENASNALRIAGGVLIGILVLSLLVVGYYNLRSYMAVGENEKIIAQEADFNKQFDIYVKDVYGSDVLSLANKAEDYNLREAKDKGYHRFDVQVTFFIDILTESIDNKRYGFWAGKAYTTNENDTTKASILTTMNALIDKKNYYGNKNYVVKEQDSSGKIVNVNYQISKLALMRDKELYERINGLANEAQIRKEIKYYTDLYTTERNIKSKIFEFWNAEYDSETGRVIIIKYNCKEN